MQYRFDTAGPFAGKGGVRCCVATLRESYCRTDQDGTGLTNIEVRSGPFEMMTLRGFLANEGSSRALRFTARGMSRPSHVRKLAWVIPRLARAVPYLGDLAVAARRPA